MTSFVFELHRYVEQLEDLLQRAAASAAAARGDVDDVMMSDVEGQPQQQERHQQPPHQQQRQGRSGLASNYDIRCCLRQIQSCILRYDQRETFRSATTGATDDRGGTTGRRGTNHYHQYDDDDDDDGYESTGDRDQQQEEDGDDQQDSIDDEDRILNEDLIRLMTLEYECDDPGITALIYSIIPIATGLIRPLLSLTDSQLQRLLFRVLYSLTQKTQKQKERYYNNDKKNNYHRQQHTRRGVPTSIDAVQESLLVLLNLHLTTSRLNTIFQPPSLSTSSLSQSSSALTSSPSDHDAWTALRIVLTFIQQDNASRQVAVSAPVRVSDFGAVAGGTTTCDIIHFHALVLAGTLLEHWKVSIVRPSSFASVDAWLHNLLLQQQQQNYNHMSLPSPGELRREVEESLVLIEQYGLEVIESALCLLEEEAIASSLATTATTRNRHRRSDGGGLPKEEAEEEDSSHEYHKEIVDGYYCEDDDGDNDVATIVNILQYTTLATNAILLIAGGGSDGPDYAHEEQFLFPSMKGMSRSLWRALAGFIVERMTDDTMLIDPVNDVFDVHGDDGNLLFLDFATASFAVPSFIPETGSSSCSASRSSGSGSNGTSHGQQQHEHTISMRKNHCDHNDGRRSAVLLTQKRMLIANCHLVATDTLWRLTRKQTNDMQNFMSSQEDVSIIVMIVFRLITQNQPQCHQGISKSLSSIPQRRRSGILFFGQSSESSSSRWDDDYGGDDDSPSTQELLRRLLQPSSGTKQATSKTIVALGDDNGSGTNSSGGGGATGAAAAPTDDTCISYYFSLSLRHALQAMVLSLLCMSDPMTMSSPKCIERISVLNAILSDDGNCNSNSNNDDDDDNNNDVDDAEMKYHSTHDGDNDGKERIETASTMIDDPWSLLVPQQLSDFSMEVFQHHYHQQHIHEAEEAEAEEEHRHHYQQQQQEQQHQQQEYSQSSSLSLCRQNPKNVYEM